MTRMTRRRLVVRGTAVLVAVVLAASAAESRPASSGLFVYGLA
jgi:hypothetical protein